MFSLWENSRFEGLKIVEHKKKTQTKTQLSEMDYCIQSTQSDKCSFKFDYYFYEQLIFTNPLKSYLLNERVYLLHNECIIYM